MFKNLIARIRQVMYRMGLIRGIEKVFDRKEIPIKEDFYDLIDKWKALYSGYCNEIHDVEYKTISGTKKRRMATLNMSKVVSQELATLIFNEKCSINISNETLAENIKSVFEANSFYMKFQDYLEYNFALGGMAIKGYYAEDDQIKLSYVTADCFIPISWDNAGIKEGVFVNEIRRRDKKYTHLEWHLWDGPEYVIRNELYESNGSDLGVLVPLNTLFPDLQEETRIQNLTRPLFVYFKPNTANNIDLNSPLGISVYANSLDTLKSLDIAFDSFQREFRLGRKRIIVPASAIKTVIDPQTGQQHRYFDATDEVYEAFNLDQDSNEIKDISVELRVEEHIAAINALLNILAMQTGFSAGSFTFDGKGVKTATEVVSENSKTFRTKQSHETVIEAGLQELVEVIIQVAELYGFFSRPAEKYKVSVTFDDSIAEDQTAEINKQVLLVTNGLTSKKRAIMKVHGVTEEEAEKILQEILKEQQTVTAQAIDLLGMASGGEG